MRIFLNEISDQEKELDFTQDDAWVKQAVLSVDEPSEGGSKTVKNRPIEAHLSLRKVDEVIVISGKVKTFLELVCSRCANLFNHPCNPTFSALFCKDPVMAGVGHLQRDEDDSKGPLRPRGQNQGYARHTHAEESNDGLQTTRDLDITYLSHEYIDLGDVITEQLQLQVPFQPLCKEGCKGMCSQCGADLNIGKCACSRLTKNNPFSVLSDFKL